MVLGQVAGGVGLGVLSTGLSCSPDGRAVTTIAVRRLAQSRWWLDRRTVRKVRRGETSQEEWFSKFIRTYRATVKWAFTPGIALLLLLSVALIVHGITS